MPIDFTMDLSEGGTETTTTTAETILELALAPRKTTTDEGSVEERSVDEMIKAQQWAAVQETPDAPLHGLRISRFKPGGPVV